MKNKNMKIKKFNESVETYTQDDLDKIAADIRNKLSPLKNIVALIKRQSETTDEKMKEKLQKFIDKEIEQCEVSIDYLTNFITKK
jgi:hypothetical protein